MAQDEKSDDLESPPQPTVFQRASIGALSLVALMPKYPALEVLTTFFRIPAFAVASEIGLTKGRLSQILSAEDPMPIKHRVRLNAAARQALLAWERVQNSEAKIAVPDTYGAAGLEIVKATIEAVKTVLDAESSELAKKENAG